MGSVTDPKTKCVYVFVINREFSSVLSEVQVSLCCRNVVIWNVVHLLPAVSHSFAFCSFVHLCPSSAIR